MKKDISLYLHIPFCIKKCNYCDFLSFADCDKSRMEDYVKALCREMEQWRELAASYRVISVFVGGGTPSVLELSLLETLFRTLNCVFEVAADAEITMEINPGTVDRKKLIGYRQLGINRMSIGLQSTHKEELSLLGRIHNYDQFLAVYHTARELGYQNLNVDLMSGLPGQTLESYRSTLTRVLALKPEHISAYSLIVEPGTPFYENEDIEKLLPDEETERAMYAFTRTILAGYGYHRYEISNYALPGKECRHNVVYWTDEPYLGLGLGAASYVEGKRFHNTADMQTYLNRFLQENGTAVIEDEEVIDRKKHMEEFLFLGLRMTEGISRVRFQERFGCDVCEVYGNVIQKYEKAGLLHMDDGRLFLTEQGISVSNLVLADFLL